MPTLLSESTNPPGVWLVAASEEGVQVLQTAAETLAEFGIRSERMQVAEDGGQWQVRPSRGVQAIIVASPDAVLPSRCAQESGLPTLRVPVAAAGRAGLALLWDERGDLATGEGVEPFATMAIGIAGAKNAALFVVAGLAVGDTALRGKWEKFRARQTEAVRAGPGPSLVD